MNKLKTTCRFCSAPLPVIEGNDHSVCEYCGKAQPIVDTPTSLQQEPDKAPHIPDTVQSPPQVSPEDKVNVVVTNKNSQHNWGCLGACIGLALLLIVCFFLVKGCSVGERNMAASTDSMQPIRRNTGTTQTTPAAGPRVYDNGMPNPKYIR